jgi:hypothetical protein
MRGPRPAHAAGPAFPMRLTVPVLLLIVLVAAGSAPAAQTSNATLNASINSAARLSLSSAALTFPDADPDTSPSIQAAQGPITVTAKARTSPNGTVTLTVRATDELRSGLNTIPASNITWVASGAGFTNGTLSATTAQPIATWSGSGERTGAHTFFFRNLWSYATGTYTLTMVYTLSAA